MRVSSRILDLDLARPFVIARGARQSAAVLQVELRHNGRSGFGEAAPIRRYGESVESATVYVDECAQALGDDPFALEEVFARLPEREFAARAAIDAAFHDLQGKILGKPTWSLLGLRRIGAPASWTVSLGAPEEMAREAQAAASRFHRLKLKLGGRDGLDVERVRAVAAITRTPLKVDVNEAWSFEEALECLPALAELGIDLCEQPLPAGDPSGAALKARSPVPIYLDEDCHTLADLAAAAERGHGINVKLAKAGGIREAVRMVHAARALGLGCMIGCMVETGLGIAAAAQIASLFDHADLDGNLLLSRDPWPLVELVDGVQLPSSGPGLGTPSSLPAGVSELDGTRGRKRYNRTVVSLAPVLAAPRHDAETVTQVLPGEPVAIVYQADGWTRIETAYGYPGWVDSSFLGNAPSPDWLTARVRNPLDHARTLIDTPYLWGGMTDAGIDCSGLVHMSYRAAGKLVPRDAYQQEAAGTPVENSGLAPGDLVSYGDDGHTEHVAFWLGSGRILHSTQRDGLNRVLEEDEPPSLRERRRTTFRL